MRLQELLRFAFRSSGEAVDEVVAVALDVAEAQQRHQRQVLLHGETGLRRQVLAGEEERARAFAIQRRQRARLTTDL